MLKKTLAGKISFQGKGLHTGVHTTLTIHPDEDGGGLRIWYHTEDIDVKFQVDPALVQQTQRCTVLSHQNIHIHTVEHAISALIGCGVDAALLEIDGAEFPILDGSALPYVNAIQEVGLKDTTAEIDCLKIEEPLHIVSENGESEIMIFPSDRFEVKVMIDFADDVVGGQSATYVEGDDYASQIAPCRTFVFTEELEKLAAAGLIRGGSLDNALVFKSANTTEESLKIIVEKLGLDQDLDPLAKVFSAAPLRFQNEAARHKLLDLLGDLGLLGKRIIGKVVAVKPGHKINTDMAKMLKKYAAEKKKLKGKPHYDPNVPPIYDTEQVKAMLPHRYPFLLVDKIIHLDEKVVVGIKNVTFNENFFMGHFPGNPVFPGVLQMEALAQTGGILALSQVEDPNDWDTYFLKMENVKFKQKVVPGDTVLLKMELLSPIRRGIVHMLGTAYVGNKIVSEGELTAQIIKRS